MSKIRILIADDHDLVREGLSARLALTDNVEICGEAASGLEVIEKSKVLDPDIIFLDISMPEMTGLEAAKSILEYTPDSKIMFLSIYDNPEYIHEALRIGAKGYMLKDVNREEMTIAINAIYNGGTYLGAKVAAAFSSTVKQVELPSAYNLTGREKQVLSKIAKGDANREIANSLNISVRTVESHRMSVREKTGGGNAADLFRIANELGLVN